MDCLTRSEEQEKDLENPFRVGETVILHEDAYLSCAPRTMLPPASGTVVLVAVNDTTTGIALGLPALAPRATCGVPRRATVATTIGAATAITIFDRILERNMGFLTLSIRFSPPWTGTTRLPGTYRQIGRQHLV